MSDNQRAELRLVRDSADAPPLPRRELEPTPDVVDAVVVDTADSAIVPRTDPGSPARPRTITIVGRLVPVQPSARTVNVSRGLAIATVTVGQGCHSWTVRAWDSVTLGVYRRQIRAADAAGDRDALAEWTERKGRAVAERRTRLMELPLLAVNVAKFLGISLIGALVLLLALACAVWATGMGEFGAVWELAADLIRLIFTVVTYAWPAVPFAVLVAAWREGNRRSEPPRWLVARDESPGGGREVIPDEGAIINALKHLGIAPLNKAFKAGWKPKVVLPTQRDGKGYRTQLEPPPGVTVEMINKKKDVLAHNLVRLPVEVWPTEPKKQPGVLDLWVADQGSLTGPLPDWPLLKDGTGDYFAGVPVSMNIRGKTIIGLLSQKNYALAGMMGSGKSTMIITLLLGAILDYLVEVDVFVFATNADYDPLKPRLRTLLTGPGDEVVEACLARLRDVYAELTVRGQALQEHGAPFVTRELAEKDERLRPRIIVIDECQALFLNEELGAQAEELCVKLMGAARKYAVTLIFATPEPSSASLPRKLMTVISNKACFAIGDQTSNDAVLGTGSYKAGISAVGLEPKTEEGPGDIGTCMASGFQARPGLLRTYYVPYAEMASVVQRALMLREKAGFGPGGAAPVHARDLLEDLAAVMGGDPIKAAKLPALLARLAPAWPPYKTLTGKQLVEDLAELGVKVPSTGNQWFVNPEDVRTALVRRESDDGEGGLVSPAPTPRKVL